MRTGKTAGQEPFAAGSRMATHSTWWVAGITSFGLVTAALATWFVGREQERQGHFVRRTEEAAEEAYAQATRALHERFDRLERMLGDNRGGPSA